MHLQGQTLDLVESSALASKVTLPSISKDVLDALQVPRTVVSSVANGFLPTIDASTKPATSGATLTLNVTEVRLLTAAASECTASTPQQIDHATQEVGRVLCTMTVKGCQYLCSALEE